MDFYEAQERTFPHDLKNVQASENIVYRERERKESNVFGTMKHKTRNYDVDNFLTIFPNRSVKEKIQTQNFYLFLIVAKIKCFEECFTDISGDQKCHSKDTFLFSVTSDEKKITIAQFKIN